MIKAITISVFVLFSTVLNVFGQEKKKPLITDTAAIEPPHKAMHILKTNPFTPLWGAIPLTAEYRIVYEFVTAKQQASQISVAYLGKSVFLSMMEDSLQGPGFQVEFLVRGFRLQATHKFYVFNQLMNDLGMGTAYAPEGLYIAPHISYSTAKFTDRILNQYDIYMRISHFNVNLFGGMQLIMDNIALDIFAGLGYKNNEWIERYSPNNIKKIEIPAEMGGYYRGNVKLSLGFNIGYTF